MDDSLHAHFCDLGNMPQDGSVSVVARLVCYDHSHAAHLMELLPKGQRFFLSALLSFGHDCYTLLDAQVSQVYPMPVLTLSSRGRILNWDQPTWKGLHSLVELCSGMGALGAGAAACGFSPTVAVDHNSKLLGLYAAHSPAVLIHGCIGDNSTIAEIATKMPYPGTMTSGFSCQPFSNLGDQLSSCDPRSLALPQTLRAAWLLRAQIIVLECVRPAATDRFVQGEIDAFCQATGFRCSQVQLQLDEVWVSSRPRWWCVLSAPWVGSVELKGFPILTEVQTVSQIISEVLRWHDSDERQLELTPVEVAAFGADSDQVLKYLLNLRSKAPCALHAWGSQLSGCACGCRQYALSAERLASRGLFGLLVPMVDDDKVRYRHIHPNECLALNSFDPVINFGDELKLVLSAAGQLAAPLQAAWIFAQVAEHCQSVSGCSESMPHMFTFQALRSWTVHRCQVIWPTEVACSQDEKFVKLVDFWNQTPSLSLSELMDTQRWIEVLPEFFTIGHVLDHIIRIQVPKVIATTAEDVSDCDRPQPFSQDVEVCSALLDRDLGLIEPAGERSNDADAAVLTAGSLDQLSGRDDVTIAQDPSDDCTPNLSILQLVGSCFPQIAPVLDRERLVTQCCIFWIPDLSDPLYIDVRPSATVASLVRAETRLYSCPKPAEITDVDGWCIPWDSRVLPGQVLLAWSEPALAFALGKPIEGLWESSPLPRMAGTLFMRESRLLPRLPGNVQSPHLLGIASGVGAGPLDDVDMPQVESVEVSEHPKPVTPGEDVAACSPTCVWSEPALAAQVDVDGTQPFGGPSPVAPLLNLTPSQLMTMSPPEIGSDMHWNAIQSQHIGIADRKALLVTQQDLLADDEIRFHLQQFVISRNQRTVRDGVKLAVYIDPLLVTSSLNGPTNLCRSVLMQLAPTVVAGGVLVTVLCSNGHWIPLQCVVQNNKLCAWTWDEPSADHSDMDALTSAIQHLFGCCEKVVCRHHRLFFTSTCCGAMALAFLSHVLNRTELPESSFEASIFQNRLREKFHAALEALECCPRPWCWAAGVKEPVQEKLAAFLREKGVPSENSGDRAAKALKAIGVEAIEKALTHTNPWRQLKTVGNHAKFQFLTPAELQQVIANNKSQPVGVKRKAARQAKKPPTETASMDPGKLCVIAGAFKVNDSNVPQLSVQQLGPAARGIVLVDVTTAEPYLRAGQQVSTEALAMLVLGRLMVFPPSCTLKRFQFPAPAM